MYLFWWGFVQKVGLELLRGKVVAKYNSHEMRWEFLVKKTGEIFTFGTKTGYKVIDLLKSLEVYENVKIKRA